MKLLLDTHAFIWLDTDHAKLSPAALAACEDLNNELYLSTVSAWEIQIKMQIGRLKLQVPLRQMIETQQVANSLKILPVELHHIYALEGLSLHHTDPFDHLLMAQAKAENAHLVSADSQFRIYPVDLIW